MMVAPRRIIDLALDEDTFGKTLFVIKSKSGGAEEPERRSIFASLPLASSAGLLYQPVEIITIKFSGKRRAIR